MKKAYQTKGVCSKMINYEVEDGKLVNVEFVGGCNGNLKGISSLCQGLEVSDIITRLEGIDCNGRGTSCPDQLAKALSEA